MLARPIRSVSSTGITEALGTGHDDSGWQINSTSCPAACSPRASVSRTASVPPYAGAGTGTHGGAMMAMSTFVPVWIRRLPERPHCRGGGALGRVAVQPEVAGANGRRRLQALEERSGPAMYVV